MHELKEILRNMEEKLPFIKENKEKLIQLFEFRIPYYVGPLNSTEGKDEKIHMGSKKKQRKNISVEFYRDCWCGGKCWKVYSQDDE